MEKKNMAYVGFGTICYYKHLLGVVEHIPHG